MPPCSPTIPGLNAFPVFAGTDLENWERLPDAFTPPVDFWASQEFWATEIHAWRDRYYLFGSFKATQAHRATQILVADAPEGPYRPLTDCRITPRGWECLDGTLHVEGDQPWMVFCREWTQTHDGGMWAMPLADDLTRPAGRPVWLFDASEAAWVRPIDTSFRSNTYEFPCYLTDGPWLHHSENKTLLMVWSSNGEYGYATGVARSESGAVTGPWIQEPDPIASDDAGHCMIFRDRGGTELLALHRPNTAPNGGQYLSLFPTLPLGRIVRQNSYIGFIGNVRYEISMPNDGWLQVNNWLDLTPENTPRDSNGWPISLNGSTGVEVQICGGVDRTYVIAGDARFFRAN